jgi:hypothetical protein
VYKFSRHSTTVAVGEFQLQPPAQFVLEQNYPNPFNPTTTIRFEVCASGFASIKVFNLLGEEVATLVNNEMRAGKYAISFDGGNLSSGVYLCRLLSLPKDGQTHFSDTKKLILIR